MSEGHEALSTFDIAWRLGLTLFFVVLNGFFVAAEFALVKVRGARVDAAPIDRDLDRTRERGLVVGQSGCVGGPDGRFVYFATEAHPGTVVELSEISGAKGRFFAHIRDRVRDWDGTEPIVRMGG